jgi:RNA polymerase sigma factor (sigma-70 family)
VPDVELNRTVGALRVALLADRAGPSDTELLDRFRLHRDEAAFAALIRRHGATVLAACRQVLPDPADLDDAFQATFLLLFRKIRTAHGPTIGSWLHAVAHRIAVRARSDSRRRALREKAAAGRMEQVAAPGHDLSWRDTVAILHEELDQLPEVYRRVLLLCYLSGQSRDEAATNLGLSIGAVKGRLERGRKMLESRLTRRGIGLSAGLMALVAGNSAPAAIPSWTLVFQTARTVGGTAKPAVLALTTGAFPMLTVAWKAIAGTLIAGSLVILATRGSGPDQPQSGKLAESSTLVDVPDEPKIDKPAANKPTENRAAAGKSLEDLADEAVPKRPQSDVGKLLNRLEKLEFLSEEWAQTMRALIQLGPNATPELIAELDATNDPRMLSCLGYVTRGIGDKRIVPALIRAFPKAYDRTMSSDYGGCGAKDPDLLAFMLKHDNRHGKAESGYSFGRPINEIRTALQDLTGARNGEDELVFVVPSQDGPPRQEVLQRSLFHKCAERWAKWWQLHWKEYVSDAYYSRVRLAPFTIEESKPAAGSPGGQKSKIYGRVSARLEPAHKPDGQSEFLQHTFHDLETGRIGQLPDFLRSAEGEPERTDDILAWAATEGFDLMCTQYRVPGQSEPRYVLRGLGLAAWQIDGEQKRTLEADILKDKPLKVGRRTDSLLARFDAATGQHSTDKPATFLFRTREGTYGEIAVGVDSATSSPLRKFNYTLITGNVVIAEAGGP